MDVHVYVLTPALPLTAAVNDVLMTEPIVPTREKLVIIGVYLGAKSS